MLKCGLPDKGGKADMVMLYMDFRVNPLIGKLFLKRKNRKIDVRRAERFFPEKTARDIARFPGLIWKIWAVNESGTHGAGFYLFDTEEHARLRAAYAEKFYPKTPGLSHVVCRIYQVLEDTSRITRAPIDLPANPGFKPGQLEDLFNNHKRITVMDFLKRRKK